MELAIGLLTLVLVLDSLFLMFLILIQLPKKEAGIGVAFGGSATDALFGAGSGTALTKMTKYCAGIFLVLSLTLSVMRTHHAKTGARMIATELERKATTPTPSPAPATLPPSVTLPAIPSVTTNVGSNSPTTNATGTFGSEPTNVASDVRVPVPQGTNPQPAQAPNP